MRVKESDFSHGCHGWGDVGGSRKDDSVFEVLAADLGDVDSSPAFPQTSCVNLGKSLSLCVYGPAIWTTGV